MQRLAALPEGEGLVERRAAVLEPLDDLVQLGARRWTRLASGVGSRSAKYRHLLDETLELDSQSLAVLAVLMLRGPQTAAELRSRTERLHPFASVDAVEGVLARLGERGFAILLERRPGQKEQRYAHLLGAEVRDHTATQTVPPATRSSPLEDRVAALEGEVATLRRELAAITARS